MNWAGLYYRWIDRSLTRSVALAAQREAMGDGEWNQFFGELGEQLATKRLRFDGLKPLYRNFRAPKGGEVDIVCRDGDFLVFVEVKTRRSVEFGRPVRAVNQGKQLLITRHASDGGFF